MINSDEKLKKISDAIFQEAEFPEDRSRPLEWRRNFNFIKLPIKNVQVINSFTIHDIDFAIGEEKYLDPVKQIKPNVKSNIIITGLIDENKMRDSIYFFIKENKESDIYTIGRHKGGTKITIKSGEPTIEEINTQAGLYWGNAFRMNFDPNEDDMCFELSMPEDQINNLVVSLEAHQGPIFEIGVYLLSYTFEVDDALREHYHSRDIIINDQTLCFASWVGVTSKIGVNKSQFQLKHEDGGADKEEFHEEQSFGQLAHQELLQLIKTNLMPLKNIATAIWVLIVVIVFSVFLR